MKTIKNTIDLDLDFITQNEDLVSPLVRILRAVMISIMIMGYFVVMTPFYPFLKMFPIWTKKNILGPALSAFCRILLKVMGFKITTSGNFDVADGTVVVANHLGYIDMFLISGVAKGCFISTVEVKQTPLFGQLSELAGCIFIERRNRDNLPAEVEKVKQQLDSGLNVIFFPEGKCTDGSELLRFRRPFFKPATDRNSDILTITMNFHKLSGKKIDSSNRHKVLWYRQKKVLLHMWDMIAYKSIEVDCVGAVLKADDYLANTKDHVAEQAHALVHERFDYIQ